VQARFRKRSRNALKIDSSLVFDQIIHRRVGVRQRDAGIDQVTGTKSCCPDLG